MLHHRTLLLLLLLTALTLVSALAATADAAAPAAPASPPAKVATGPVTTGAPALAPASPCSTDTILYSGGTDIPKVGKLPPATAGQIMVNDTLVFNIPGAGGGVPLAVRAEILDCRLTEILSTGKAGPICVGAINGKPTIWACGYRLLTIYPEDAAAEHTTMQALAATWAHSVQEVILQCSNALGPGKNEVKGGFKPGTPHAAPAATEVVPAAPAPAAAPAAAPAG